MEDNGNDENQFRVVFSADKDESFDNTINKVEKQLNKVQPERKIRFSIDPKSRLGRDYQKQFAKWDALMKVKTSNGPLGIGRLFKDQRELSDMEKYFGKLKLTAMNALSEYNDQLDKLKGKNRDFGDDSYVKQVGEAWNESKKDLEDAQKRLESLRQERDALLKTKSTNDLLPETKTLQKQKTDIQNEMNSIDKILKSAKTLDDSSVSTYIDKQTTIILEKFQDAASKATALIGRGESEAGFTLFSEIVNKIKEEQSKYDTMSKNLQSQLSNLQSQSDSLNSELQTELDKTNPDTSKIEQLKSDLSNISMQISSIQNQSDKLDIFRNINTQKLNIAESEWANRTSNAKVSDMGFKTSELDSKTRAALSAINTAESRLSNSLQNVYSGDYISSLRSRQSNLSTKSSNLSEQIDKAKLRDVNNKTNEQALAANADEMKQTEQQIKQLQKETDTWKKQFEQITNQVKTLDTEMKKLNADMQSNPLRTDFMSNTMQKMNSETESMNLKWMSGAYIWEKIKAALNGTTGYIKKITPLSKIVHKVWLNIYSQIATLVNPLNIFRRTWDDWINRWDNLPIKNTFEVISYNFTTILEPLFKRLVQLALQLLQYANVFTKKWFGVDLFDKQAWAAEKFKKQIGMLTASFDELHSSSTNPNEYNTIFDTGDIKLDPVDETVVKKLEDWAKKIGDAFKWIIDNWKLLVALWAGFKIGSGLLKLFNAFGGLGTLLKNMPGLWTTFKNALPVAGAIIGTVGYLYNTVKLAKNWDQLTPEERQSTANYNLGFGTLMGASIGGKIGGISGGITGGLIGLGVSGLSNSIIADYNGDREMAEQQAALSGAGFGGAIGKAVGGAIGGPVGAAIGTAAGAALGALVGYSAEKIGHWFTSSGDYAALKISAEDLASANEQLKQAQDNVTQSLMNLKSLEEQTGESGEALYKSVQNGTLSMDNMTSSQLQVYQAYVQHKKALETLHQAQQKQMDYETKMDLDRAKNTGNYEEYVNKMLQANEDGIYSNEELQDRLSQIYASLSGDARETFLENIPEDMRQGVINGSKQYISGFEKFWNNLQSLLNDFGNAWGKFWDGIWNVVSSKLGIIGDAVENTWNWIGDVIADAIPGGETSESRKQQRNRDAIKKNNPLLNSVNKLFPSYDVGTNYVPNDQLAMVHKGEAIIPAKYNKPYNGNDNSVLYSVISDMNQEIANLRSLIQGGIPVSGTFVQRGSDLYATVEKAKNKRGNNPVSNPSYAR